MIWDLHGGRTNNDIDLNIVEMLNQVQHDDNYFMITLIHGDDTVKSREALFQIREKAKGKEIRELEGKTVKDDELIQALSSSSLFGGDTIVIIENLFSGLGKKIKRIQELATVIKQQSDQVDIVLWESKEVGKTAVTGLGPTITQRLFKLPTIIFQFLDTFTPGNGKRELELYRELLHHEPPELVHAMLVKRLRTLLILKSGAGSEGLASWQLTRLTNQMRPFTLEQLTSVYKKFRLMEQQRNNGTAVFELREGTELLLAEL